MSYYHEARDKRYEAGIFGCDPDLIIQVENQDDDDLLTEALERSGLSLTEFAEDVLLCDQASLYRWRLGSPLPVFVRRFLRREIIRVRHRIRHHGLPDGMRCVACGRSAEKDERPLLYVTRASDHTNQRHQPVVGEPGGEHRDELGKAAVAIAEAVSLSSDGEYI